MPIGADEVEARLGGTGGQARRPVLSPVLVGRAEELSRLMGAIAAPPALAVVEGEAGVGKSRLVQELLASPAVAERRGLVGHSHALRQPFHLGPVVEALRELRPKNAGDLRLGPLGGALRPVLPELAAWLPPAPEALADPSMERHRLWRALAELLGALGPAVVVLEDLHWADEDTIGFLSFLVAEQPENLALVVTWRAEELAPDSAAHALAARLPRSTTTTRVTLSPFDPAMVKALVGAILDTDDVSEEFAAFLHDRTSGLPFAVEEVLALLQDRRDLVRWGGRWARRSLDDIGVPAAIREAVAERLGRLGPDARRVAQAASVLDMAADEAVLTAVSGLPRAKARTALVGALDSGLLVEQGASGRYGFRHALAAQAAYGSIAGPERRQLHSRAVRAIEAGPPPLPMAQLAHHCKHAGLNPKWARYAEAAAEQALELRDPHSAALVLVEALSVPGLSRTAVTRISRALCSAAMDGLAQMQAVPALRAVLAGGRLALQDQSFVRFHLAGLLQQAGDASGARVVWAAAVDDWEHSPFDQALTMAGLAMPWVLEGNMEEHLEWLERAEGAMEASGMSSNALLAERAAVLSAMGDPLGWEAVAALAPEEQSGRAASVWVRLCANVAVNAFFLGHYERAQELVTSGVEGSSQLGYVRLVDALESTSLLLSWATGHWDGLEHKARSVWEGPTGLAASPLQGGLVLGSLLLARGEQTEPEEILAVVNKAAARCGGVPIMAAAAAAMARLQLARSDPEAASHTAVAAMEAVASKNIWVWAADVAPVAVEALLACCQPAEAKGWVDHFGRGIADRDAPAATAAHHLCAGLVAEAGGEGGAAEAQRCFGEALACYESMPRPYEAAQVRERLGLSVVAGNHVAGSALLFEALEAFSKMGASWDQARVTQALRQHGVALKYPFRGGPKSYGEELSPREREVAELAAKGLTNAEIAEQLFLSARTVEHHLARAMRKLSVVSRRNLAGALSSP